jgi:hypothetical protein
MLRITFSIALLLTLASSAQVAPQKIVVYDGQGGPIVEADSRWKTIDFFGPDVEIRGPCRSACPLVISRIRKDKLCFGEKGSLWLHQTRDLLSKPGEEPKRWEPNDKATKWLVDSYPPDIRAWIEGRGGVTKLPYDGYWFLFAPDLWEMGYRKCED